jgi:hypothetical protein
MIDLNDPTAICRSLGYFWEYLITIAPIVAIAWATWRIAR